MFRRVGLAALVVLALPTAVAWGQQPAPRYTKQMLAAAQHEVRVARADGTLRLLDRQVLRRQARAAGAGAAAGPSASQQALAVALFAQGSATVQPVQPSSGIAAPAPPTGPSPASFSSNLRRAPVAHAASCFGTVQSEYWHTIAGGAIVIKMFKYNYGWCGDGSTISQGEYNFNHYGWAQYPYCLTSESNSQGWDGTSHAWAHGGYWASQGFYTGAFICLPALGGAHATLRIAANGYWDRYDDYGY